MADSSVLSEPEPLVNASYLDAKEILHKTSAYRLAKAGRIRSYLVGPRRTGVRFRISEVLDDLRRPSKE